MQEGLPALPTAVLIRDLPISEPPKQYGKLPPWLRQRHLRETEAGQVTVRRGGAGDLDFLAIIVAIRDIRFCGTRVAKSLRKKPTTRFPFPQVTPKSSAGVKRTDEALRIFNPNLR